MNRIIRTFKALLYRKFYVTLDGSDNSVTCSKKLLKHMRIFKRSDHKLFVFKVGDTYGFCFVTDAPALLDEKTQFTELQFNGKYKTTGFETLNPSVQSMFYAWNMPHDIKLRLEVYPCRAGSVRFYEIQPPSSSVSDKRVYDKRSKPARTRSLPIRPRSH